MLMNEVFTFFKTNGLHNFWAKFENSSHSEYKLSHYLADTTVGFLTKKSHATPEIIQFQCYGSSEQGRGTDAVSLMSTNEESL